MVDSDSSYALSDKEKASELICDEQTMEECSDNECEENYLSHSDNSYLQHVRKRLRSFQKRLIDLGLIKDNNKKSSGGIISRLSQQSPSESRTSTPRSSNNQPTRKSPRLSESSTVASRATNVAGTSTRTRLLE